MESKPIRITPRLCRAARALLGWQQADLATHSGVSKSTISQFELRDADGRLTTMNNKALIDAFETAGLLLIPENGGGAGLRLAKPGKGASDDASAAPGQQPQKATPEAAGSPASSPSASERRRARGGGWGGPST